MERLGLSEELSQAHPETLSGGEVQRVGIARALAHEPRLVLADEPTGALDEANTEQVVGLLVRAAKELGAAVVITTHDPLAASKTDRVLKLHEGKLIEFGGIAEDEKDQK